MATTIPVPLTTEEQTALEERAQAQGVSLDSLLRIAVLSLITSPRPSTKQIDFEQAFAEIADMIPDSVPDIPDEALSRESIYSREDEW